jgi:hypothetical protein
MRAAAGDDEPKAIQANSQGWNTLVCMTIQDLTTRGSKPGRPSADTGTPDLVDVHDFPSDAVGKAIPYGVYDSAADHG